MLALVIVGTGADLIKLRVGGVMLQVQDHTLGKVHKIVVINYFETLCLIVGVVAMHERLVEEEHRVRVARGTD